jgi:large conductance mechanosensitive channel
MWKEFKDFIMTGNVLDFAIAVILAGAVGVVVNGFVQDIIMPVVGHFSGGMDFSSMRIVLDPAVGTEGEAGYVPENAVRWGAWLNTIISLLIIGFVLFMMGKAKIRAMGAAPAPGPTDDQVLLAEIRDALKK